MSDYTKLVEALRCCIGDDECEKCPRYEQHEEGGGCIYKLNADAAAAIEALQAEVKRLEPKRGEWIEETSGYNWYGKCSVCGKEMCVDAYYADMKFCPNCGAKMGGTDESTGSV